MLVAIQDDIPNEKQHSSKSILFSTRLLQTQILYQTPEINLLLLCFYTAMFRCDQCFSKNNNSIITSELLLYSSRQTSLLSAAGWKTTRNPSRYNGRKKRSRLNDHSISLRYLSRRFVQGQNSSLAFG